MSTDFEVADICTVACAESFRGDGQIFCNPIGTLPVLGGRLARATFEPGLVYTDTVSMAILGDYPVGEKLDPVVESYTPYRTIFDIVWSGKRHVMMGASQIDMWGNQNIAAIGDFQKPKAQLLGLRGAPGNLINHATSYFVPNHSVKSFVKEVDVVSGPGYDKLSQLGPQSSRFFDLRCVISNLGVFDFKTPDNRMRIRTLHPGVSLEDVVENTGFELAVEGQPDTTREPLESELALLNDVLDPKGLRFKEVPQGLAK